MHERPAGRQAVPGRFHSHQRLAEALETVPKGPREVALLPSWQDGSLADSGPHLGHSPATVAALLPLSLQQWRGLLRESQES